MCANSFDGLQFQVQNRLSLVLSRTPLGVDVLMVGSHNRSNHAPLFFLPTSSYAFPRSMLLNLQPDTNFLRSRYFNLNGRGHCSCFVSTSIICGWIWFFRALLNCIARVFDLDGRVFVSYCGRVIALMRVSTALCSPFAAVCILFLEFFRFSSLLVWQWIRCKLDSSYMSVTVMDLRFLWWQLELKAFITRTLPDSLVLLDRHCPVISVKEPFTLPMIPLVFDGIVIRSSVLKCFLLGTEVWMAFLSCSEINEGGISSPLWHFDGPKYDIPIPSVIWGLWVTFGSELSIGVMFTHLAVLPQSSSTCRKVVSALVAKTLVTRKFIFSPISPLELSGVRAPDSSVLQGSSSWLCRSSALCADFLTLLVFEDLVLCFRRNKDWSS